MLAFLVIFSLHSHLIDAWIFTCCICNISFFPSMREDHNTIAESASN